MRGQRGEKLQAFRPDTVGDFADVVTDQSPNGTAARSRTLLRGSARESGPCGRQVPGTADPRARAPPELRKTPGRNNRCWRSLRACGPAAAARDPDEPARFADGAARPAGHGQGACPDRRRHRPRVSHELLAAVADRPQEQLEIGIDQLVGSELVFRRGSPPDATYSFKHALAKDAAYRSLLKSMRQQLHARVARVFEERFPAVVENPTRAARLSPDRSRARRARGGCVGASRSRGPRSVGDARGGELAHSGGR
jgi:hypothetical protein